MATENTESARKECSECQALDLNSRRSTKVDQQSQLHSGGPEIIDRLRPMLGRNGPRRLQLYYDPTVADEISDIGLAQRLSTIGQAQRLPRLKWNAAPSELHLQALL